MLSPRISSLALLAALAATAAAQADLVAKRPPVGADLKFADGTPATTFFRRAHDEDHHHDTCKVFHHVRALDGTLLTLSLIHI